MSDRSYMAEMSVIGGMMMDEGAASSAIEQLAEFDFDDASCKKIFKAALQLVAKGKRIDSVTILSKLGGDAKPFVLRAAAETPSISGYQHYIDIVLEESHRRKLIDAITQAHMSLIDGGDIAEAEQTISSAINTVSKCDGGVCTAGEAMRDTIATLEKNRKSGKPTGITTGFSDIDIKVGTFQPKGYYIVGARSGMGKTALLLCMIRAAAKSGKRSLVFSLEMPSKDEGSLATRLLTQETQIEHDTIRFAKYTDADLKLMNQQAREPYMQNIIIDDRAGLTVMQICASIRRFKPEAVYIDYIGLIKAKKAEKREIEVSEISHELKNAAKQFGVPIVALAQLNRETEKRKDGKPIASDIRESDAIFQDADMVIFLYREAQYSQNADEHKAELIVSKNRQGKTGIVPLSWTGETMTFRGVYVDGSMPAAPPRQPKLRQIYEDVEEI